MELEEMKLAWQQLDRRLEQQLAISQKQLRDSQTTKARHCLRPLFWGQVIQMIFGVLLILLAVSYYWSAPRVVPHLLFSGVIIHVYGVLTTVLGAIVIGKIGGIDYAAPVAAIQKQLAQLISFCIYCGMVLGLSWWLLWMPFMAVVFGLLGADIIVNSPEMIFVGTAIGVVGLLANWWFHRWSHHPSRPRFAQWVDDSAIGASLTRARKLLDEIAQFEQEQATILRPEAK